MSNSTRYAVVATLLLAPALTFLLASPFAGSSRVTDLPIEFTRHPPPPLPPEGPLVDIDGKLKQAFGESCEELRRPGRLWFTGKKVALAFSDFSIADDGRVRMAPLSIAFFKDAKGEHPEIVCVRCDEAWVTLDRPATAYADLAARQVVKAELSGGRPGVFVVYNRGSADKQRSLDTLIINGSVFFDAKENRLTTDGVVCITDWQQSPTPAILRGKGMEIQFATTEANSYLGVIERLTLRADAEARFVVDAKCHFMTIWHSPFGNADQRFVIKSGGVLTCDFVKQTALLEAPEAGANTQKNAPDTVYVQRHGIVGEKVCIDQLTCDRLELQFRHGPTVDIVAAEATSRQRNDVALAFDSERAAIHGNRYTFTDGKDGSHTVITGEPLFLNIRGDAISCQQLSAFKTTKHDVSPTVTLLGPGQMDLLDWRNQNRVDHTKHLRWRDKLMIGNPQWRFNTFKAFGTAEFVDDENQQEIRGDQIDVRLGREPEAGQKR